MGFELKFENVDGTLDEEWMINTIQLAKKISFRDGFIIGIIVGLGISISGIAIAMIVGLL